MSLPFNSEQALARLAITSERRGDCLIWTGRVNRKGYGRTMFNYRTHFTHRVALALTTGVLPPPDVYALHSCDTPACIEPSHLRWGSATDNARDAVSRGRHAKMRATECLRGHEYTPANTYTDPKKGGRSCKECRRAANRRHKAAA